MPNFAIRHLLFLVFAVLVVGSDVILDAFTDNQITNCCAVYWDDDDDGDDEKYHPKHSAQIINKKNTTCKIQNACKAIKKHVHHYYVVAQQVWESAINVAFIRMIAFSIEDHRMVNFDVINLIYEPPKLTNH